MPWWEWACCVPLGLRTSGTPPMRSINAWSLGSCLPTGSQWDRPFPQIKTNPPLELREAREHCMKNDHCDHCTSGKRGRQTVYTVTDGSAVKQVGTACLLEYTGITPEMAESWLKLKGNSRIDWATHTGERNKRQHPSMSLTNMAVALALYANTHGRYRSNIGRRIFNSWVHAVPTSNGWGEVGYVNPITKKLVVIDKIHGIEGSGTFFGEPDELPQVSEAVWNTAQDIIKYMTDLPGLNNFEHNLRTIAKAHVVTSKTAGYAGGALAGWLKRKPEPAPKPMPTATSEWLGKVGERMTVLPCKVTFVRRIDPMGSQLVTAGDLLWELRDSVRLRMYPRPKGPVPDRALEEN